LGNGFSQSDALGDKVLEGARISSDEALQLYQLPLEELGALANVRRNLAKEKSYGGRGREIVDLHCGPQHQLHQRLQCVLQVLRVLPDGARLKTITFFRWNKSTRNWTNFRRPAEFKS